MDCSTPGFPVLRYLLELAQTHVHWVGVATQPSHPLSSPLQHQGLFQFRAWLLKVPPQLRVYCFLSPPVHPHWHVQWKVIYYNLESPLLRKTAVFQQSSHSAQRPKCAFPAILGLYLPGWGGQHTGWGVGDWWGADGWLCRPPTWDSALLLSILLQARTLLGWVGQGLSPLGACGPPQVWAYWTHLPPMGEIMPLFFASVHYHPKFLHWDCT